MPAGTLFPGATACGESKVAFIGSMGLEQSFCLLRPFSNCLSSLMVQVKG
jgi:hypothetical protein